MIRSKPEIYCPDRALINMLLERHSNFDIFWYHWPRDGVFFIVPDYEPVVICYHADGSICLVIVRKAWDFESTLYEELIFPLRIIFDRYQHHPVVVTNRDNHSGLDALHPLIYNELEILMHEIPDMFRTGKLHPSNFKLTRQEDPIDYANQLAVNFCKG